MKVKIGPYTSWFGPYQLAELLCFWAKPTKDEYGFPKKPDWVHKFGEWLAHGSIEPTKEVGEFRSLARERNKTWLYKLLSYLDSLKKRKVYVHIDDWDVYSMDDTLAIIILPMLKKLKEHKQGAPYVEDADVPEELRSTSVPPKENEWDTDDNHFKRWDWVLDEMIFAFTNKLDSSWEEQFESGKSDYGFVKLENGMSEFVNGPNHTKEIDWEARKAYQKRISNGFLLFGKYYEALWD